MTNKRLNGLSLMFIHHDLTKNLNIDDIVDEFAREHPRHMELVNCQVVMQKLKCLKFYTLVV